MGRALSRLNGHSLAAKVGLKSRPNRAAAINGKLNENMDVAQVKMLNRTKPSLNDSPLNLNNTSLYFRVLIG